MRLEENPLIHTEIESSSEYELESETSTGFTLLLYISSPPTLLLPLASPISSPPSYNTMSQHNLHQIIRQQQEQLAAIQVHIQALIVGVGVAVV